MAQKLEDLLQAFIKDNHSDTSPSLRSHYAEQFRELDARHTTSTLVTVFSAAAGAALNDQPVIVGLSLLITAAAGAWAYVAYGDFKYLYPMLEKYKTPDNNQPSPQ